MTEHDEIRQYLDANSSKYTREALRAALLSAGHAEADVDAALTEWSAAREAAHGSPADRATFRRWALGFHLAALVVMVLVVIALKGAGQGGTIFLGAAVLVIALLIGWWLSSLIGRALLPRTGVIVALLVPLISALILGGTCIGLMNAAIPTPPLSGGVTLAITSPQAFSGTGAASCYTYGTGTVSQVNSQPLGEMDGMTVTASIGSPSDGTSVFLSIEFTSEQAGGYRLYTNNVDTDLQIDASSDGMSGQVTFANLAAEPGSEGEPLTGVLNWNCEA
jgi:hypothetical protein